MFPGSKVPRANIKITRGQDEVLPLSKPFFTKSESAGGVGGCAGRATTWRDVRAKIARVMRVFIIITNRRNGAI